MFVCEKIFIRSQECTEKVKQSELNFTYINILYNGSRLRLYTTKYLVAYALACHVN